MCLRQHRLCGVLQWFLSVISQRGNFYQILHKFKKAGLSCLGLLLLSRRHTLIRRNRQADIGISPYSEEHGTPPSRPIIASVLLGSSDWQPACLCQNIVDFTNYGCFGNSPSASTVSEMTTPSLLRMGSGGGGGLPWRSCASGESAKKILTYLQALRC